MTTCATCRFLAAPRDSYDEHGGVHVYDPTYDGDDEQVTSHRTCVRIIHGNGNAGIGVDALSRMNAEPALVTDGSGYAARLVVLPTFGCVLHEEKA